MSAKPNELELTRVYDAPVKLVWEAYTDLKHVAKWWGPRGFTVTTKSKDLRPGGKWIYTMHGPDGTDYPNIATYHEVVKYEKLVYDHGGNEDRPKLFTVTATFKEEKGKTTLHMIFAFSSGDEAKQMKGFIKQAGGNSTWDRLGEYLENEQAGKDVFIVNRSFHAPPDRVFEAWVKPEKFAQWGGATPLESKKAEAPTRFVYEQSFQDKTGKLSQPLRLLTTVTLHHELDHDEAHTRATVHREITGSATDADRKTFLELRATMTQKWDTAFDKLDELLTH